MSCNEMPWLISPDQKIREVLASTEQVTKRIETMAGEVLNRYRASNPLFLILLAGGVQFGSKIIFSMVEQDPTFQPEVDYLTVSSYKDGVRAGELHLVMDLRPEGRQRVNGRPVIAFDDVLDLGNTAAFTRDHVTKLGATSFDLIPLVQKQNPRTLYQSSPLFGFESPEGEWLTGMGMDNGPAGKEANRWLGAIAVVESL